MVMLAACAPRPPALPSGSGTPFADFASAYAQATAQCGDVRTITLSIALSGKAGTTKLRGHIDAGFAAPANARLEGLAPFGKPVFVLVASEGAATLVLPRDNRVLRGAPPDRIVEALAGVPLGPADMRTVLAGCGFSGAAPVSARAFAGGWVEAESSDTAVYLRQDDGRWYVAAARRSGMTVTYTRSTDGRPAAIRLRAVTAERVTADLTMGLSQVDINTTLDPRTFEADVPPDAAPLTLDELRRAGPLGDSGELPIANSQRLGPSDFELNLAFRAPRGLGRLVLGTDSLQFGCECLLEN
ncbi:MAG: hypothetical protein ACRD1V_00810 [Vicinamibacterales bacterium]